MEAAGPAIRIVGRHEGTADPASIRPILWERERMPRVADIEIVGGNELSDGIELRGTMMATIAGVLIRRCRYGVRLLGRNRNLLISHAHIYDSQPRGIGVYFDGVNHHQAIISGSHISYCRHAGIKVERSEVRNLQITGCDIEYNHDVDRPGSADIWIDARVGTVREVTIASNTIQAKESPEGSNIRIEGADSPTSHKSGLVAITGNVIQSQAVNVRLTSCRGVTLTGNTFATGFERSIVLDRCRNVVIDANFLDHNPDYEGRRVDGIVIRRSAGITVSGMVVEAVRAGDDTKGAAVEATDSAELLFSGLQILDPAVRGFELENVEHCRIVGSTIIDRRPEKTMLEAVRARGKGGVNVLEGCTIGRGRRAAIDAEPGVLRVGSVAEA
ncbi:MAG: right-handed parallel beta-helix repeat-containing protein [Isosphaeraceae bacterium]|nr:right-handed parallel beta-helix repeat-containing protein [Isosphaeraceae bacterium]